MDWDFQQRAGVLDIKNFGVPGNENVPVLNASGRMDIPGIATDLTNRFSGPLLGTLGNEAPTVSGLANGSFVANGSDKTAGLIGNFSVATLAESGLSGKRRVRSWASRQHQSHWELRATNSACARPIWTVADRYNASVPFAASIEPAVP